MDSIYQTSSNPTDWSMQGVTFEARESYESAAYSYQVNFIIQSVKFSVERVDSGSVSSGDSAEFRGTALPYSVVSARLYDNGARLNYTIVGADGIWNMDIDSGDLPSDASSKIYFENNGEINSNVEGQTIGKESDDSEIVLKKSSSETAGIATWIWVLIAIVALAALLGVGAFFFLEFEEEFEDDPEAMMEQQKEEDPYAWAKARAAEQAAGNLAPAPAPVPAETPQHPGWIWDAQSNQWVADPNYNAASSQVVQNITNITNIHDSVVSGDAGIGKNE